MVWGRRYEPIVVTQEERAQVARLKYLLAHGAKEGLVPDPREWPGIHCAKALLDDEPLRGIWFDRSKEYAARRSGTPRSSYDFASVETVTLSPLPCWADLPRETIRLRVNEILTTIVSTPKPTPQPTSEVGTKPNENRFLHPHFRPPRTKRSPAPLVHAASDEARQQFLEAYGLFLAGSQEKGGTSL